MAVDAKIAALLARMPVARQTSLEALRADAERSLIAMQGASEQVDRIDDIAAPRIGPAPAVPIRAYRPAGTNKSGGLPAIVFAHAGGWRLGSLAAYDNPCRALANATGCVVFSAGYRLAPEHPYPVPLEDFYRALCWIADHMEELEIDGRRIVVAGDSAGGNLAAAAALLSRDRRGPPIAHQLLFYPALDTDLDTPSYRAYGDGYFLTRDTMRLCWSDYLGDRLSAPPIYAAPLRADLSGLPSATIMVNEYDPLRSEGEAYARKLRDRGVPVSLIVLEGMVHACMNMRGVTPAAEALFLHAGREIRQRFGLLARVDAVSSDSPR